MGTSDLLEIITQPLDAITCYKCQELIDISGLPAFTLVPCPACGAEQKVPVQFGKFYLVDVLGKGGMGAVYKGLDATLGRYVAIKVMSREMGEDHAALNNFLGEARATAALNHRNVVQIYDAGEDQFGQPFIVMEMVPGGRFDKLMKGNRQVDEAVAIEVCIQVANGLMAAHNIGLIHGDIKPANILFGTDNAAKVVDFGLARFMASHAQDTGEIWGTPFYVAPEKVKRQGEDQRSDLYSLGATLFHALAGRPPFDGETATDVVIARVQGPAPDIRTIRPEIHEGTARVIARMLEEEPARRHPNYRSLIADLESALEEVKSDSAAKRTGRHGLIREPEKPGSNWGVIGGVVALILLLVVAVVLMLPGKSDEKNASKRSIQPPPGMVVDANGEISSGGPAPVEASGPAEAKAPENPDWLGVGKEGGDKASEPAGVGEPEKAPEPQLAKPPAVLFSTGQEGAWRNLLQSMADKRATKPDYDALLAALSSNEEKMWVELAWAVYQILQGDSVAASQALGAIEEQGMPGKKGSGQSLVIAAPRFLRGEISFSTFSGNTPGIPETLRQVRFFLAAVKEIEQGQYAPALRRVAYFVKYIPEADYPWVGAFHPLAKVVDQELRAVTSKSRPAAPPAGMFPTIAVGFGAPVDTAPGKASKALPSGTPEQIAADRQTISSLRGSVWSRVKEKKFEEARDELAGAADRLGTDAGSAHLQDVLSGYEDLSALHEFLVAQVRQRPFGNLAQNELGGPVSGADEAGLQVTLGAGTVIKPWSQVSSPLYVWMAEKYISASALSSGEKARLFGAVALFCYEGRGLPQAQKFFGLAVANDAACASGLKERMPELAR